MPIPCNEIDLNVTYLQQQFEKCNTLNAEDLQLLMDLYIALLACIGDDSNPDGVTWLSLLDTYAGNYTGSAGFIPQVNDLETGLELFDFPTYIASVIDNKFELLKKRTNSAVTYSSVANMINTHPEDIVIDDTELLIVQVTQRTAGGTDLVHTFVLNQLGKNTYGNIPPSVSNQVVAATDLVYVGTRYASLLDYQDIDSTQIIDLGDITGSDLVTEFNNQSPCVDVQAQADGYVIVTLIDDGTEYNYLYIGGGTGNFGSGCAQAQIFDFELLGGGGTAEEIEFPTIPEYTGDLINNGNGDGGGPFITFADLFTGNSIVNNQAGVLHESGYTFTVWGRSYIIEQVAYIDDFISGTVELSDSHPTLDRKDTFVIQDYTPAVGNIVLDTGAALDTFNTLTVDGGDILGGAVAFDTSLARTATLIVNQINAWCVANNLNYNARNDGAIIYIYDRSGDDTFAGTIAYTATGITATPTNFSGGSTDKSVGVITGIAAATPYEPVPFYEYQVKVSTVDVAAGSSDPGTQVETSVIYNDNLGSGSGEWDVLTNTSGVHPDTLETILTDEAYLDTKYCLFDAGTSPLFLESITWEHPSIEVPFDITQGTISFRFKTRTILSPDYEFRVEIQDSISTDFATVYWGVADLFAHGWTGTIGQWDLITVNLSEFGLFTASTFNRVSLTIVNGPQTKIDLVQTQAGFPVVGSATPNLQQVTDVGNITTNVMQTPSIFSDQLTETNWFRATKDYLTIGNLGDGAGDAYGGTWDKYLTLFDSNNDSNALDINIDITSDRVNMWLAPDQAYINQFTGTSSGRFQSLNGVPQIQRITSSGITTLDFESPTFTNQTVRVPDIGIASTTKHLAIGINDGINPTEYAGTDGIIDVSGLVDLTLQEVLDNGNTYTDLGTLTADIYRFTNSASSAELAVRLDKTGISDYYSLQFTDATGAIVTNLHNVHTGVPGTYDITLPTASGMLAIAVNSITPSGLGNITLGAANINIADAGAYYTGSTIELALQEIGADLTEWTNFTGTRAGSNLDVQLGDYDASGNGTEINLVDASQLVRIYADNGFLLSDASAGPYAQFKTSNLTSNVILEAPDFDGTLALVPIVNADSNTTYNFDIDDSNKIVTLNNASPVSAVIPANASVAYPVGTKIDIINLGAGTVTVSITSDTLNTNVGGLTLAQYDKRTITKVATTTWILSF